jgi:hypothetical protein
LTRRTGLAFAALSFAAACADAPTVPANAPPPEPLTLQSTDQCAVDRVEFKSVDRSSATQPVPMTQGQQDRLELRAINANGGSINLSWCNVSVTSSNTAMATVSQTYDDVYARTYTVIATGGGQVTITASIQSIYGSGAGGATFTYAVTTATPTVSSITGPTTITSSGTYNYSVSASGGSGTYTYYWDVRHGGGPWTVVRTHTAGSTSSASISIVGGRMYEVRVRVISGNSATAYSPVLTVDATSAPAPLGVAIEGYDNIRTTGVHTFEAIATGGTGSYSYEWTLQRPDGSVATGTDQTFSIYFPDCEGPEYYILEVTVTAGAETSGAGALLNVEIYRC